MSKKSTQAAATATQPALIDNLATLFANSNKDYCFGLITDSKLFEIRVDAINNFMADLSIFPMSGKFMALQRLAICYAAHTPDGIIKDETLYALSSLTHLLENISLREQDIEIWADFTSTLYNEIANNNH